MLRNVAMVLFLLLKNNHPKEFNPIYSLTAGTGSPQEEEWRQGYRDGFI
jgi:hypothetical protein